MAAAFAALGFVCQAQVVQPRGTMPGRRFTVPEGPQPGISQPHTPAPHPVDLKTPDEAGSAPDTSNLPPSLLNKPPEPARVTLNHGTLSVNADNSSLSAILESVQAASGMKVDGFDKDSRIFGIYGPGPPRDVLSSLLDGAGYNFLMVGATATGAPRELVLTARSNAPISPPTPSRPDEEDDQANYPPPPEQVTPPPPVQPTNMPPAEQRPRTPQEMLQELQRLRMQQQQQGQQGPQ